MADGILCKYCGYQETEHNHPDLVQDPDTRLRGFKEAFIQCPGFVGRRKPMVKTLTRHEMAYLERRAMGNAAWGLYGAMVRQAGLDEKLEKADKEINEVGRYSNEEKAVAARARKESLLRDARRQNASYLHIGPY